MRGCVVGLLTVLVLAGCAETEAPPAIDMATFRPHYVDVVTQKIDSTAHGLNEVHAAVRENTHVLQQIKTLVEQNPAAGGVEPLVPPSLPEQTPPPAPPYWETDTYYVQYFTATWCGPCRTVKPRLKKVIAKYGVTNLFTEFDADRDKAALNKSGIKSLPTIVICKRGVHVDKIVGSCSEQELDTMFDRYFDAPQQASVASLSDLVKIHDDLHNAASGMSTTWTWPGDLKTHLRTVHGVGL